MKHYEVFPLFKKLPAEIRIKIWTMSIPSSGRMHTARIVGRRPPVSIDTYIHGIINNRQYNSTNGPEYPDVDELIRIDPEVLPTDNGQLQFDLCTPVAAIQTERHLRALERTCFESRQIAHEIRDMPGNQLTSDGRLLTLQGSSDIVCLQYMDLFMYAGSSIIEGTRLPAMFDNLCRVAFHYCRAWEHPVRYWLYENNHVVYYGDSPNYPFHLYQFMAKNMPALEDVFLIDYRISRGRELGLPTLTYPASPDCKSTSTDFLHLKTIRNINKRLAGETEKPESFSVFNIDFHQVLYGTNWEIPSKVMEFRQWLRHRYVYYAKNSPHCQHRSPEKVRFHVLACEYAPPAPEPAPRARDKFDAVRVKRRKEAFKRWDSNQHNRDLYLEACGRYQRKVEAYMRYWGWEIPRNNNHYEFTGVGDELAESLSKSLTI